MTTPLHSGYVLPAVLPEPRQLDGFDLLVNEWSDYVIRYAYVIDDRRLVEALGEAVSWHPYFSGRKTSSGDAVHIANFSGVLFTSCISDQACPEDIDLLERSSHGYLHGTDFRRRHKIAPTSSRTPLLQIKHTICPNGSVLGVSVWHAVADFGRIVRFFETLTDIYNDNAPIQRDALRSSCSPVSVVKEADYSDSVVFISPELRQPFPEPFAYRRFPIGEEVLDSLHSLAASSGVKWTAYLFAAAWKVLGSIVLEKRGDDLELFLIQSIEKLSPLPEEAFNQLIYPTLRVRKDVFSDCSISDLAIRIRNTGIFSATRELKSVAAVRAWMNRNINGRNYHDFMLRPFHASIFGSGVLCNNFAETRKAAFDFGEGEPLKIDVLPESGLRLMALSPFEAPSQGYTFVVALFESELGRFEAEFSETLNKFCECLKTRKPATRA